MSSSPLSLNEKGNLKALLAILFWSTGAYFICLLNHLPKYEVLSLTLLIGGYIGLKVEKRPLSFRSLFNRLRTGWPIIAMYYITQYSYITAFRLAPAVQVDLINYLWPLMMVAMKMSHKDEDFAFRKLIGILVGFSGIAYLLTPEILEVGISPQHIKGYLFAFSAALSWTLYTLLHSQPKEKKAPSSIMEDIFIIGIINTGIQLTKGGWEPLSYYDCYAIMGVSLFTYGISFPLWKQSLHEGNFVLIGSLANIIPILSIGWLIIGGISPFTPQIVIATLLVCAGCLYTSLVEERKIPVSDEIS